MSTKIVFFGTHDFGAGILDVLIGSKKYDLVAVVTQPDRPVGRRHELQQSAVKILAVRHGLHVLQPELLKTFDIGHMAFDLTVVCQYGLIIPKNILDTPKYGSINVHTSLLPKYRGASPIQSAIASGEVETGVTIMQMDEKMDHGPILSQAKISIGPDETYRDLQKKMLPVAQQLLLETLPGYLEGKIKPRPQNENEATFCKIFSREDGKINWQKTAEEIYNQYRGLTPWPGVWTMWNSKRLKLLKIRTNSRRLPAGKIETENQQIFVGTSNGAIEILSLQLEGKKEQTNSSFIAGHPKFDSTSLT